MKKVAVLFADGFEEIEALTPVDYLRRAGADVAIVSLSKDKKATGAHHITILADANLDDLAAGEWDAVLLPGGMPGSANLAASNQVGDFVKSMAASGKIVAAICAAPAVVLAPLGLLNGRKFTCYPGMEKDVIGGVAIGAEWSADGVVADGNIITSRGAGTAAAWSIALIGRLFGKEAAIKLADSVVFGPTEGLPL
jgi:4-methyl-5(b-hydroxyethyl)-thiazole monophosphate biosynthesis